MNELEKCPLCGKIPKEAEGSTDIWCVNNLCKLFEIHIPRKFWNVRPIENSLREDLIAQKREVDEVKNSHLAMLREELDKTRNSSIETQKESNILKSNLNEQRKDLQTITTSYSELKNQNDALQKELEKYKNFEKEAENNLNTKLGDIEKAHQHTITDMQYRLKVAEETLNIVITYNVKLDAVRLEEYKAVISGLKKMKGV